MASNRINRINEEIQKELSNLFRGLKDPRVQGGMVTITHVDTTSDLRYSRIFVSVLDKTQEKDVVKGLKSAAGYLRRELGAALRLRYTPELQFVADDSIEYGAHILEMLRDPNVVKPANPENETIHLDGEEDDD
ncbi:MAG: 30S ribosome-binding factor RbfA [Eubacteriales bacterium]|nr:30S ribosome-binding factor RbfA [Eubacteriales bacterium]